MLQKLSLSVGFGVRRRAVAGGIEGLPRALLGALIGAALGLAGAAMQSYLRNPLAEPGTLGVSSMAALGGVLSIFFGVAGTHRWTLPLCGVAAGVALQAVPIVAG